MKLVMTLLVRNEEDILADNLDYHLNQGVDFIIATDNGSEDGTLGILRRYEKSGYLRLIREPEDDYSQAKWVTRMARLAAAEYGADWVINNDADEFWWPLSGSLKSTLESVPDRAVEVTRVNFPALKAPSSPFWKSQTVREVRSFNAVGQPLPPKVCHRADPIVEVSQGNHSVNFPAGASRSILIFHFPMRSYSQMETKIRMGGAAYERNKSLPKQVGGTWRELYRKLQAGELRAWFDEQALDESGITTGISEGRLIRDLRLASYLERMPRPVVKGGLYRLLGRK